MDLMTILGRTIYGIRFGTTDFSSFTDVSMYLCIYVSIYLSIYPSIYLSIYLGFPTKMGDPQNHGFQY